MSIEWLWAVNHQYYGRGKRTSVYGAFLLAAYNPSNDTYETICNIGTVLAQTKHPVGPWGRLNEYRMALGGQSPRELASADEFQGTTGGGKGVSLRFPRYIKSRDDKKPDEATTTLVAWAEGQIGCFNFPHQSWLKPNIRLVLGDG
jgi:DNA ligase-1